jgi:hypothetical protein
MFMHRPLDDERPQLPRIGRLAFGEGSACQAAPRGVD